MQAEGDFIFDNMACVSSSFSTEMKAVFFTQFPSDGVNSSPLRKILQSVAVGVHGT
jgi:hypothetical protein